MKTILKVLFSATALSSFSASAFAETVNIYSYRQPDLIKPVLDEFTKQTGIKTQVQFLK